LAEEFFQAMGNGKLKEKGFPNTMYGMSKLHLYMFTRIFASSEEVLKRGI